MITINESRLEPIHLTTFYKYLLIKSINNCKFEFNYWQMERASLNLEEVGSKANCKWELYRLLTVEGCLYFPPQDQTNMEFISDIFF